MAIHNNFDNLKVPHADNMTALDVVINQHNALVNDSELDSTQQWSDIDGKEITIDALDNKVTALNNQIAPLNASVSAIDAKATNAQTTANGAQSLATSVQNQLSTLTNEFVDTTSAQTINGAKNFTNATFNGQAPITAIDTDVSSWFVAATGFNITVRYAKLINDVLTFSVYVNTLTAGVIAPTTPLFTINLPSNFRTVAYPQQFPMTGATGSPQYSINSVASASNSGTSGVSTVTMLTRMVELQPGVVPAEHSWSTAFTATISGQLGLTKTA